MTQHARIGVAIGIGLLTVAVVGAYMVVAWRAQDQALYAGVETPSLQGDKFVCAYTNKTNRTFTRLFWKSHYTDASGTRIGSTTKSTTNLAPGQRWQFELTPPKDAVGMDRPTITGY